MPFTGNAINLLWTILDLSSDPLTGMTSPADVTFTLHRDSGSAQVAASETITLTEIGSTGHYTIDFTPDNSGRYVLQLKEISASTLQRTWRFHDMDVTSAGAGFSATYANAFCAETDIERWLQQAITSGTSPDDAQAAAFAEARASLLASMCAKWGFTVTPSTIVAGTRLEDILREANAIGGAHDYSTAQQFSTTPSRSDRSQVFDLLWFQYIGDPAHPENPGYLESEIKGNLASLATDHILSGDTSARATTTAPIQGDIEVGMGDLF